MRVGLGMCVCEGGRRGESGAGDVCVCVRGEER